MGVLNLNAVELKASRTGLCLAVAEAAELFKVNKRTFQYWEAGRNSVPQDVTDTFFTMTSHYNMILKQLSEDVERVTIIPKDNDISPTIKPTLPFFTTFEEFEGVTGCGWVRYWRIYQAAVSQLFLIGAVTKLDNASEIPKDFRIWRWFDGDYECR